MHPFFVPRTGLEPVHREVLVFETNASTNSAIWAIAGAKVRKKSYKLPVTSYKLWCTLSFFKS